MDMCLIGNMYLEFLKGYILILYLLELLYLTSMFCMTLKIGD